MASVWFEPGSNATGDLSFWTSTSGTVASATDQAIVGPRAIKLSTGNPATFASVQKDGILADAGRRITFLVYLDSLPGANNGTILDIRNGAGNSVLNLGVQTTGQLRAVGPGISGVNSTNGLTAGTWHRIAFSYVVTNSTTFEIKVYLDGVLEITITNSGTLTNTGSANLRFAAPALFGVTHNVWIGTVYVDDGTDRADPGNISVTAKRPNANGGTNTFGVTTSTTNSGYGTGNSIYVNERPLATTGQRRINNNSATGDENFTIEDAATGDVDLTGLTLVSRMAWAHGSGVSTDTLWDNGAAAVPPAGGGGAFTSTAGIRYKITDTSSYPTSGSAVGMGRPTGNSTDCILNECGMVLAYLVSADVSVGLTGIASSGALGAFALATAISLSGLAGTGSVGTITGAQTYEAALTGVSATANPGTLSPSNTILLTGEAGTVAGGTLSPSSSLSLVGEGSTGEPGSLTPAFELSLSGQEATGEVGTVTESHGGSATLSGLEATGASGALVPSLSVALSGQEATGDEGTLTPSNGGSAELSGVEANAAVGSLSSTLTVDLVGEQGLGDVGTVVPALSVPIAGVEGTSDIGTVTPDSADVTVDMTGVQATSGAGILSPALSLAISGHEAAIAPGTLAPTFAALLAGEVGTGQAGSPSPQVFITASGIAVTLDQGAVSPESSVPVSGLEAIGDEGALSPSLSLSLTGEHATGETGDILGGEGAQALLSGRVATTHLGVLSPSVSVDVTGISASGHAGTLSVAPVWPAICRTSVIGPSGPIHVVSAVEVSHTVSEDDEDDIVSEEASLHTVTDQSVEHTVSQECA